MTKPTKQERFLHDFRFAGDLPALPETPATIKELAAIYAALIVTTGLPPVSPDDLIKNIRCNHVSAWLDAFLMCWDDIEGAAS